MAAVPRSPTSFLVSMGAPGQAVEGSPTDKGMLSVMQFARVETSMNQRYPNFRDRRLSYSSRWSGNPSL